jgi:N-acyl-D-aspartate/D-glutamate deacylase
LILKGIVAPTIIDGDMDGKMFRAYVEHVLGEEDKQPTPEQMQQMRELVRSEMEAGALGIGSSLIYAPAFYARTDELIELCKVAAKYKGKYISHMRSEGNRLEEAVEELIRISRETIPFKFNPVTNVVLFLCERLSLSVNVRERPC